MFFFFIINTYTIVDDYLNVFANKFVINTIKID